MPILIRILNQVLHLPITPGLKDLSAEFLLYSMGDLNILLPATYSCYFSENGQLHEDCLTIAAGSPGEIFMLVVISSSSVGNDTIQSQRQ